MALLIIIVLILIITIILLMNCADKVGNFVDKYLIKPIKNIFT